MPRQPKNEHVGIRMPEQLKRRLQRAADRCGESVSSFVMRVVAAEVVKLEDRERVGRVGR